MSLKRAPPEPLELKTLTAEGNTILVTLRCLLILVRYPLFFSGRSLPFDSFLSLSLFLTIGNAFRFVSLMAGPMIRQGKGREGMDKVGKGMDIPILISVFFLFCFFFCFYLAGNSFLGMRRC